MNRPVIAPSVLAADFANLQSEIEMLNRSEADWIHVDVMDGVFVPNISFGLPVTEAIHKHAAKPLDVHLMIQKPENYLDEFKKAGASSISIHYEACAHLHRNIHHIKSLDCLAGVAINPHTSVKYLEDIIEELDFVCVMSVNPGYGGQKFIKNTYRKIEQLKEMITDAGSSTLIEIDGGVSLDNARQLIRAGADILVAGSFIFSSSSPTDTISELKHVI